MSANVDKVLAVLDAGLQSSEERGYPERIDDASLCARCIIHEPAPTADICRECRAFLLGDSDVDPIRAGLHVRHDSMIRGYIATSASVTRVFVERLRAEWSGPDLSQLEPDPAWVAHHDPEGRHVHSFDYIGQCECGVCDIGVRPSLRVRFQRLDRDGVPTGEVQHQDLSGYVTMHLNGDRFDNRPENLRIVPARENLARIECPAQPDEEIVSVSYYVDGHGDVHTSRLAPSRDWLAEAMAHVRRLVADARGRLGL